MESLSRVDVEVQTSNVHAIVGRKDGIEVGSLVVLLPLAWQGCPLECLPCLLSQPVEHSRGIRLDGLPMLVMQLDILF